MKGPPNLQNAFRGAHGASRSAYAIVGRPHLPFGEPDSDHLRRPHELNSWKGDELNPAIDVGRWGREARRVAR